MWGWISTLATLFIALALLYFVVKGVLFIGWAIGAGLAVLLLFLLMFEVLDLEWVIGLIFFIFVLVFLLETLL